MALAMAPPPGMMAPTERPIVSGAPESPSAAPQPDSHRVFVYAPPGENEGRQGKMMLIVVAVIAVVIVVVEMASYLTQP